MESKGIINFIQTRRSIRKFTTETIPEETRNTILESAMFAPSAVNKQPWQFVVADDPQILKKIPPIHKAAAMAAHAPLAILVCGEREKAHRPEFMDQDCSAAIMNILYAAHGFGLGAVWCGVYPDSARMQGFAELFNIPEGITPFGLVVMGYPKEQPVHPNRWRSDKIHINTW